jgi:translocation protein SEC63
MRMNIALPEWVFAKDSKTAPLLLGLLVAGGVLAPLVAACIFLWRAGNVVGVADVAPETVDIFLRSKWCVKEAHTVRAMPDTLVMAFEFITRPLARNQGAAMTALQRDVVTLLRPDLKDKAAWWKRRPSILKSEFIFIAHTARHPIPPELADDAAFHLAKAPALLDKVVEVARVPRTYGWPYGWLAPIIGAVEYAQCLAAGLPPHVRRPPPGKGGGPDPALAALPHVDGDALKRLARRKVRSVAELAALDAADRAAALTDAGLGDAAAADVGAALAALPRLALADAAAEVDGADGGSDDVRPGDLVTVSCRALLTRAAHDVPGATPPAAKVVAFAPHAGRRVVERWWVIVGDAARNVCFAVSPIDLREAERAAFHPAVRDGLARGATPAACASAAGATVSLAFEAPPPGKYDLTLYLLCDAWVGADASVPLKMKVSDVTRAEREGRVPGVVGRPPAAPSTKAPKRGSDDDDGAAPVADDDGAAGSDNEGAGRAARGGASDGGDDDDGDATDSDDREWDSEETGTEASSDDEAVVAAVAAARAKAGVARKASSSGAATPAAGASGAATPAAGASGAATPAAGASADKEIEAAE